LTSGIIGFALRPFIEATVLANAAVPPTPTEESLNALLTLTESRTSPVFASRMRTSIAIVSLFLPLPRVSPPMETPP
jgi:hypothetical protein